MGRNYFANGMWRQNVWCGEYTKCWIWCSNRRKETSRILFEKSDCKTRKTKQIFIEDAIKRNRNIVEKATKDKQEKTDAQKRSMSVLWSGKTCLMRGIKLRIYWCFLFQAAETMSINCVILVRSRSEWRGSASGGLWCQSCLPNDEWSVLRRMPG